MRELVMKSLFKKIMLLLCLSVCLTGQPVRANTLSKALSELRWKLTELGAWLSGKPLSKPKDKSKIKDIETIDEDIEEEEEIKIEDPDVKTPDSIDGALTSIADQVTKLKGMEPDDALNAIPTINKTLDSIMDEIKKKEKDLEKDEGVDISTELKKIKSALNPFKHFDYDNILRVTYGGFHDTYHQEYDSSYREGLFIGYRMYVNDIMGIFEKGRDKHSISEKLYENDYDQDDKKKKLKKNIIKNLNPDITLNPDPSDQSKRDKILQEQNEIIKETWENAKTTIKEVEKRIQDYSKNSLTSLKKSCQQVIDEIVEDYKKYKDMGKVPSDLTDYKYASKEIKDKDSMKNYTHNEQWNEVRLIADSILNAINTGDQDSEEVLDDILNKLNYTAQSLVFIYVFFLMDYTNLSFLQWATAALLAHVGRWDAQFKKRDYTETCLYGAAQLIRMITETGFSRLEEEELMSIEKACEDYNLTIDKDEKTNVERWRFNAPSVVKLNKKIKDLFYTHAQWTREGAKLRNDLLSLIAAIRLQKKAEDRKNDLDKEDKDEKEKLRKEKEKATSQKKKLEDLQKKKEQEKAEKERIEKEKKEYEEKLKKIADEEEKKRLEEEEKKREEKEQERLRLEKVQQEKDEEDKKKREEEEEKRKESELLMKKVQEDISKQAERIKLEKGKINSIIAIFKKMSESKEDNIFADATVTKNNLYDWFSYFINKNRTLMETFEDGYRVLLAYSDTILKNIFSKKASIDAIVLQLNSKPMMLQTLGPLLRMLLVDTSDEDYKKAGSYEGEHQGEKLAWKNSRISWGDDIKGTLKLNQKLFYYYCVCAVGRKDTNELTEVIGGILGKTAQLGNLKILPKLIADQLLSNIETGYYSLDLLKAIQTITKSITPFTGKESLKKEIIEAIEKKLKQ